MDSRFKGISDADMLAGLMRRKNARRDAEPKRWRHDCGHFRHWNEVERGRHRSDLTGDAPDDYNPCTKGHEMRFEVPDELSWTGDDWGYYRRACEDRQRIAAEPPEHA